ncbi:MAG: beta strand repeat-containing protein, partial [Bacteroidota bacterium]
MKTPFVLFVTLFAIQVSVAQGTFTSSAAGNWSSTGTWTLSSGSDADGIPDSNDDVILATAIKVNMDGNHSCNNLTMNGTSELDFTTNNRTLFVNGNMTMNGTSQVTGNTNTRILSLLGNFTIPAGQTGTIGGIQFTQALTQSFTISGTFNPASNIGTKTLGNVVINSTGSWNATSNETYSVQNCLLRDGSLIDGSSTAILNVLGNLTVSPGIAGASSSIGRITLTVTGTTTVNSYLLFTTSASGTKTFNNTITVNTGATWDDVIGEDYVVNCNIVNYGLWPVPTGGTGRYDVTSGGSYTYSGTNEIGMTQLRLQAGSTVTNLGNLHLTKSNSDGLSLSGGSTFVNGNGGYLKLTSEQTPISAGGTNVVNFAIATNTVEYAYAGNQNVYSTTYSNMICSNGGTKNVDNDVTVNSTLTITGSTIVDVDNGASMDGTANLVMTGTSQLNIASAGTVPEFTGASHSLAAGTTIEFSRGDVQTAASSASYPYQNVLISGGGGSAVNMSAVTLIQGDLSFTNNGTMTNNAVLTVAGTLDYNSNGTTTLANNITVGSFSISNGTFTYSNRTITVNGDDGTWTNNGSNTLTTNASSQVIFTTGSDQLITGTTATTFPNLTLNNSNGVTLSGVNATVSGTLTLTTGNLLTGSNIMIIPSGGTVSRTNGFVEGNLQKFVATGATSVTFEIGTGTIYSPVDVTFASVSVAGSLICSATAGDHPDVNGSNIEPNRSVNRYWTLTNSAITFTTYSATFNYDASDKDVLADHTNFQIKRTDGVTWGTTTIGTRTATSTQFTGEALANLPNGSARSFACGELINTSGVFNRASGANNWNNLDT